jgi:hypothetical protein
VGAVVPAVSKPQDHLDREEALAEGLAQLCPRSLVEAGLGHGGGWCEPVLCQMAVVEQVIVVAVEIAVAAWVAELGAQEGHCSVLLRVAVAAVAVEIEQAWVAELEAAQEGHCSVLLQVVVAVAVETVAQNQLQELAVDLNDR